MSFANAIQQQFLPRALTSDSELTLITLTECDQFSARQRDVLQGLLELCASGLERRISESLTEFERQLICLADKATINQQDLYFDSIGELKRHRGDVFPRFLRSIEDSLARLGRGHLPVSKAGGPASIPLTLELTDGTQLDETLVLCDIATKVELRVREPLYALGHRFGELAGTPRVAAEVMPLGPRAIAEALRYGTAELALELRHRLVLYRCFERVVMDPIGPLFVVLNNFLIERNILPHLHMLPAKNGASESTAVPAITALAPASAVPTATPFLISVPIRSERTDFFLVLRQLVAECRRAETFRASANELQVALADLQVNEAIAASSGSDKPQLRSAEEFKQQILAHLHERCADGRKACIGEEDTDVIDLIAMLFEFLSSRARSDGIVNWMLAKLQVPVLRAALADKRFFSDAAYCVRQLLNLLIEAGTFWVDENEGEADPTLVEKLQRLTRHIACESQGEAHVFAAALQDLSPHIDTLLRRVEGTERRNVDAAVGREKFEYCRLRAAAAIGDRIAKDKPNEFLRTLLERGWVDVLTVTLLREGEGSEGCRRQLEVVDQLLAAARAKANGSHELLQTDLRVQIETGLAQVGLHDKDVRAITQKLFVCEGDDQTEDPISQTELAIKLKLKARLGGEQRAASAPVEDAPESLGTEEQAMLDRLHTLPLGTWFNFSVNQHGDTVRRKLSWCSALTGHCLFINQRGVPTGELTMHELARQMASGQASIANTARASPIDQAWEAICETLGSFLGGSKVPRLPVPHLIANNPGQKRRLRSGQEERAHQESRTLLLVDDDENILRALTRVLRSEGYRILSATSAREGLKILGQQEIQVIVSDQRMPEVNGTEFLSNVKAIYPNTVRILLSGYSDAAAVTDAISRGAIYKFLTKPWDDGDMVLQVRDAFRACELRQESCVPLS